MPESRQRVIESAAELFLGGSFHQVGIAYLCEHAQVNKGTFYHFFPSKVALLLELIELYVGELIQQYAAIAASDRSPAEKMHCIFMIPQSRNQAWKTEHGSASGCLIGNMCLELAATEPAVREKTAWALRELSRGLQPIVRELLAAENITTIDVQTASETVMSLMQGAQVIAKAKNEPSVFAPYGALVGPMLQAAGKQLS